MSFVSNGRKYTVITCPHCKVRLNSRKPHRKGCRAGVNFMGKKYDAYVKAAQAEGIAKNRYSDVQGGSTKDAMTEATNNAIQAERASNDAWQQFIEDPEG